MMRSGLFAAAACAIAALAPGSANADTTVVRIPLDFLSAPACGGAATLTVEGTLIDVVHTDAEGNLIFDNNAYAGVTFTYSTATKSITSIRGALERFSVARDGTSTLQSAGLFGEFILPGVGLVRANVGLITVTFDAAGNVTDVQLAGIHDGRIAQYICPYLLS